MTEEQWKEAEEMYASGEYSLKKIAKHFNYLRQPCSIHKHMIMNHVKKPQKKLKRDIILEYDTDGKTARQISEETGISAYYITYVLRQARNEKFKNLMMGVRK